MSISRSALQQTVLHNNYHSYWETVIGQQMVSLNGDDKHV